MNYIEREIEGLEPDVVLLGASSSRKEIYDYSGRLIRDLHFPPLVIPTHWDNFFAPCAASQQPSIDALQSFVPEVRTASPKAALGGGACLMQTGFSSRQKRPLSQ
jgi:hypothetical protein